MAQSIRLVLSTIAATNTIAASDYQGTVGNTANQATADLTIAAFSTVAGYNNTWTLNGVGSGSGLDNVSLTSITKFGLKNSADATNTAPTWASSNQAYIQAEVGGGTNPPRLVITYTRPVSGGFFLAAQ